MFNIIYFIVLGCCLVGLIGYYISFKKYCKEHDVKDVRILEKEKKK